jgi:hypothetical protein
MLDETETRAKIKEDAEHLNIVAIEKVGKITLGSTNKEGNKSEKVPFKGHEFALVFTSDNENKARREAHKCRKRGFHTRVREMCPGKFPYIAAKKVEYKISPAGANALL